jgi:hypothetical protein
MKKVVLAIFLAMAIFACGSAMQVIRTIIDIATLLCENAASEKPISVLKGQTPQQFCKTKENLQPFVDQVTRAKMAASRATGLAK